MMISAINKYYYPSFTSLNREVKDADGNIKHRNNTCLFRSDMNWSALNGYIKYRFSQDKKVNIYDYACSDGSEAYSLALKLNDEFGEKDAKRFFPIIAKDYDEFTIDKAKSGKIALNAEDVQMLDFELNDYKKYIDIPYVSNPIIMVMGHVNPKFKDNVQFETADIMQDCSNIPKNGTNLILCRNFWPYLPSDEDRIKLAEQLYNSTDCKLSVVIGGFDKTDSNADNALRRAGFRESKHLPCIYEKAPFSDYDKVLETPQLATIRYMTEDLKSYGY